MPKEKTEPLLQTSDLYSFQCCGKAVLSPDGRKAIVPVQRIDKKKNTYFTNLYMIEIGSREVFRFTYGDSTDMQPIWSPDGKWIVFVSNRDKTMQLWKMRVSGGEAVPLTTFERGSLTSPVWSPDGAWIAVNFQETTFTGVPPEEPKKKKGSEKPASPLKDDFEKWQKDEARRPKVIRRLMYKVDGAGLLTEAYDHIWLVNPETGELKQLTRGSYDCMHPAWFPDSKALVFAANRTREPDYKPMFIDLWKIPVTGGRLSKIHTPAGPSFLPSVSPDGNRIAYVGHDNPDKIWATTNNSIWIKDLDSGRVENLTAADDRSCGNYVSCDLGYMDRESPLQWSADGASIYYDASEKGACRLFNVDLATRTSRVITRGPVEVRSFSFSKDCSRVVVSRNDLTAPAEIYLYSLGKNIRTKKLTSINEKILDDKNVTKPEEMWFDFEGFRCQGWLIKPPDFDARKKYPLIIQIHGGPHILYGYNFFFEFHSMAAQGFLVFYMNPRGSMGYGEEFTRSIIKDWGGPDYRDLMNAVQQLAELPFVDKQRLGVTGGSYGGYMTNWIVGHTKLFKAAVTQRSVTSLPSLFGTSDAVNADQGVWGSLPWEMAPLLRKLSPLTHVENITTPLLIIHSECDNRCPIEQAEQLYVALKHLRRTVEFVRYPEESHELSRGGAPDHREDRLNRITKWFMQYLKEK